MPATRCGVSLCLLGRPDEGLALLRWSLEMAEEVGDPESLNRAYGNLASCLVEWARLEEAAARDTRHGGRRRAARGHPSERVGLQQRRGPRPAGPVGRSRGHGPRLRRNAVGQLRLDAR